MVVAILAIMAAVSVPMIFQWLSGYRLRAGVQEVAGELQTARTQAIMKNVGRGVALYVVDSNTYRYVNLDLAFAADATAVGTLHNLPDNILFDSAATALPGAATTGFRFSRLGGACAIDAGCFAPPIGTPLPAPTGSFCSEPECNDNTTTDFAPRGLPADGTMRVGLRDDRSGLTSIVLIDPGGRIQSQ
jgi:hypothetical protein